MADQNTIGPKKLVPTNTVQPKKLVAAPVIGEPAVEPSLPDYRTGNPYASNTKEYYDYERYDGIQQSSAQLYSKEGKPTSKSIVEGLVYGGVGDAKEQETTVSGIVNGIDRFLGDKKYGELSRGMFDKLLFDDSYSDARINYNINNEWLKKLGDTKDRDDLIKELYLRSAQARSASLSKWKMRQAANSYNNANKPEDQAQTPPPLLINPVTGDASEVWKRPAVSLPSTPNTGDPFSNVPLRSLDAQQPEQFSTNPTNQINLPNVNMDKPLHMQAYENPFQTQSETVQSVGDPKQIAVPFSVGYTEYANSDGKVKAQRKYTHGKVTPEQYQEAFKKAELSVSERFDRDVVDGVITQLQADIESGAVKIQAKNVDEWNKATKKLFDERLKAAEAKSTFDYSGLMQEHISYNLGKMSPGTNLMYVDASIAKNKSLQELQNPASPEIQQAIQQSKAQVSERLRLNSYYQTRYAPKTKVPIDLDKNKGQILIGNTNDARANLLAEFDQNFLQALSDRQRETGDERYSNARINYIMAAVRDIITTDQGDDGLVQAFLNVPKVHRRIDWMWNALGLEGEMEALVGKDPYLNGLVQEYKQRFQAIRTLSGVRANHGSAIDVNKLNDEYTKTNLGIIPTAKYLGGIGGFVDKNWERSINQVATVLDKSIDKVSEGVSQKTIDGVWNLLTSPKAQILENGEMEVLPSPLGMDLRNELRNAYSLNNKDPKQLGFREDNVWEKVSTAVAHLMGSIKQGSFNAASRATQVSAKSISRAWEIAKDPKLIEAASASPHMKRLAEAIENSPRLKKILENSVGAEGEAIKAGMIRRAGDALTSQEAMAGVATRGAATFALAHVLEDFPEATPESILEGATTGILFTATGKLLNDYIFHPIVKRTSSVSKALNDPEVVASLERDYGANAAQYIKAHAQRQKDLAYAISNTVGNPIQGYVVQTSLGNDYDLSAFLIDALIGAPAGKALAKASAKEGVSKITLDVLARGAEAVEHQEAIERYNRDNKPTNDDAAPITNENVEPDITDRSADVTADATTAKEERPTYQASDFVQYVIDGVEQFPFARRVVFTSPDGRFVFVEGHDQPIPTENVKRETAGQQEKVSTEAPPVTANDVTEVIDEINRQEEIEREKAESAAKPTAAVEEPVIPKMTVEYKATTVAERVAEIPDFYERMTDVQKRVWNEVIMPLAKDGIVRYTPRDTTYDPKTGEIEINYELRGTPDEVNAIVHEALHKATVDIINSNPEIQAKLVTLAERLQHNAEFKRWALKNPEKAVYLLDSPYELLAGLLDNKHGIHDMLAKHTRLGGAIKDIFNTKVLGYESGVGDVLNEFNELVKQFATNKQDSVGKAIERGAEEGRTVNEINSEVADPVTDERTPTTSRDLSYLDDMMNRFDNEIDDSRLGMYRKYRSTLYRNSEATGFVTNNDELKAKYAQFYVEAQRRGMGHPVYLEAIADRIEQTVPNWERLNPSERADAMLDAIQDKAFALPDAMKAELDNIVKQRELAEKIDPQSEIEELTIDKRTLSRLVGDEHIVEMEDWLSSKLATPELLIDDLVNRVTARTEELNVDAEVVGNIVAQTKSFAVDYIRNHGNLRPVTALALGKTIDGKTKIQEARGEIYDSNSGVKHQHHIVNPDPFINRLQTLRNEILNDPQGNALDIFPENGIHRKIIDAMTNPNIEIGRLADYNTLINSGLFDDAEGVGNQLRDTGWFLTSKGHKANVFLKLDFIARNNTPETIAKYVKAIEEINLVRYLNSERTVGVGNRSQVARGLNVFDIWKLVDLARSNRKIQGGKMPFDDVLRSKVKLKDDWYKHAVKNQDELRDIGNMLIEKLALRYKDYRGNKPEILHEEAVKNPSRALVSAVNAFYHKVQDHGNLNDLPVINDKLVKDQTKYWGVSFQSNGYWRYKDAKTVDAVLKAVNPSRKSMNIEGKSSEEVKALKDYWKAYGIDLRDDGTAKIKQFILSDTWAENNPTIWAALSGQDVTQKLTPPSKHDDGASWIIDQNLYGVLADMNNFDEGTSGNIKFGYGNEWIYKSDLAPLYETGNLDLDNFLFELRTNGITTMTTQSAIKSKANNYLRTPTENLSENVVYDHDGTVIALEHEGTNTITKLSPEEIASRYSDAQIAPELVRTYDLFGPNAWSYVNHASRPKGNNKVTLNLNRHAYTLGAYAGLDDPVAKRLQASYHNARLNLADKWRETFNGVWAIDSQDAPLVNDKNTVGFVKKLIGRLEEADASDMPWKNEETQKTIVQILRQSIIDDTTVNAAAVRAVENVYGNILRGNKSMRSQILGDEFTNADKVKVTGAATRLVAYTPKEHHLPEGLRESLHWNELAAQEEAQRMGLTGEEKAAYIATRGAEYEQHVRETVWPAIVPNGRLMADDAGIIMGVEELRARNEAIHRRRMAGSTEPYLTVGSKVIAKLNPPDGIQSFAPRVIVGLDKDAKVGVQVNHKNLIDELSRDFDGDDLVIIHESDDWYRDDKNTFYDFWATLWSIGAYKGDPYSKVAANPRNLKAAHGKEYRILTNDRRIIGMDGYDKQLAANSSSGTAIKDGISALNAYYELANQRGFVTDLYYKSELDPNGSIIFEHSGIDINNIKASDIYTKTAQYDTYTGYEISPYDVFLGSRVRQIRYYTESEQPNADIQAMVDHYNSTGQVDKKLYDTYVKAIRQNLRSVDTSSLLTTVGRLDPISYGQSGQLARIVQEARKNSRDPETKLYNAIVQVASEFQGNDKRLVEGVENILANYRNQPLQAKYNPFNAINLDPLRWQALNATDRGGRAWREQVFHIREMLGRTFSTERQEIPISENAYYKVGRNGMYLVYGNDTISAYDIFQRSTALHPMVERLLANEGITYNELFPRDIIGHVSYEPIIGTERNNNLEKELRKNPDVTIIRGTMFGPEDLGRDKSSALLNYDNFKLVSYKNQSSYVFQKTLERIIQNEISKGRRVILDANTMGNSKDPRVIKSSILDVGRAVKVRRFYDTRDQNKLIGKAYAMLGTGNYKSSSLAMQLAGEMMLEKNQFGEESVPSLNKMYAVGGGELYQVYQGIKEAGGITTNPDGTDILQSIIANQIKAELLAAENPERLEDTTPLSERQGRKLGLFNGSVSRLRPLELNQGRAGAIARLNKLLGQDILRMSGDDIAKINSTLSEWLQTEFADVPLDRQEEFVNKALHAFDPLLLQNLEKGLYADIKATDNGENKLLAHKSVFMLQFMQQAKEFEKSFNSGKLKDWWFQNGLLAEQSTTAMIRYFANDTKLFNGETPIYDRITVDTDYTGRIAANKATVLLRDTYDKLLTMPRYVSMESATAMRHHYRHNYLMTVKDQWATSVPGVRQQIASISNNNDPSYKPTRYDIDLVKAYLDGSDVFFTRRPEADPSLPEIVAAPQPIQMRVSYNGASTPQIIASINTPNGIIERSANEDGSFSVNVLNELAAALLPDSNYTLFPDLAATTNVARMSNVIKHAIVFKANNLRQAAFQTAMAEGIKQHIEFIRRSNADVDEVGNLVPDIESPFYKEIALANGFANELSREAEARINAGLVDNLDATTYVNYDQMAVQLGEFVQTMEALRDDAFSMDEYDKWQTTLEGLAQYAERFGVKNVTGEQYEIGQRVYNKLKQRLRHATDRNNQITKTMGKFTADVQIDQGRPSIFDPVDRNIMQDLFGQDPVYDDDIIFRRNQEVIQNVTNRLNAVFLNLYRTEKQYRKAAGFEYLDTDIAENNLLTDMSADNIIYKKNIDVSPVTGLRKHLNDNFINKQQSYLDENQLGVTAGTPISVTYTTRADYSEMQSINGRLLAVVRLPHSELQSKRLRDAEKVLRMDIDRTMASEEYRSRQPEAIDNVREMQRRLQRMTIDASPENQYKDMLVMMNQRTGSLSYIDMSSISNVIAGHGIGKVANTIELQQGKYLRDKFGSYDELAKFLVEDQTTKTMKTIDLETQNINIQPVLESASAKHIPFFGTIGRDKIPPRFKAQMAHYAGTAIGNFASHYNHGMGRQLIGTGLGIMALPVSLAVFGDIDPAKYLIAYNLAQAGRKYFVNMLGNRWGYASRSAMVFQNSPSLFQQYKTILQGANARRENVQKFVDIGVAQALMSRRLGQGVGVTSETFLNDQVASEQYNTVQYAKLLAEMQPVKDIVDGWGRVLTPNDLVLVDKLIKRYKRSSSNIIASIQQGQLSLKAVDPEGKYIGTLSDIQDMNIDAVNRALVMSGQLGLLAAPATGLAKANAARLALWHMMGSTEQEGLVNATAESIQEFERTNADTPALSGVDAATNFAMIGMDILQGKFDQRPVNMKSPLGRLWSLFSQYRRNFDRQTILATSQQRKFWNDFYLLHAEDEDFRRSVITKYGVDVGDQRIQAAFMPWNEQDMSPGHWYNLTQAQKNQGLHAFITKGLDYLLMYAVLQGLTKFVDERFGDGITESLGRGREQILGESSPIAEVLVRITELLMDTGIYYTAGQYEIGDEPELQWVKAVQEIPGDEKEFSKSIQQNITQIAESVIPGGGYMVSPARNVLGLLGNYMGHHMGWMPIYKEPDYQREILKTLSTGLPPVGIAADVYLQGRDYGIAHEVIEDPKKKKKEDKPKSFTDGDGEKKGKVTKRKESSSKKKRKSFTDPEEKE